MKKSGPDSQISREEIQKAVKEYLNHGGRIKILPDQKITVLNVIGSEKWDAYESIYEFTI